MNLLHLPTLRPITPARLLLDYAISNHLVGNLTT